MLDTALEQQEDKISQILFNKWDSEDMDFKLQFKEVSLTNKLQYKEVSLSKLQSNKISDTLNKQLQYLNNK